MKKNSTILVNHVYQDFWEISFISEIDLFFLNSALGKRTLQWFCYLLHCCSSDNDNIDGSNSILPQNVTVYWVVIIFPVLPTAGKKLCAAVLKKVKEKPLQLDKDQGKLKC